MTFYVYVEPDAERRTTIGAVYSDYGFDVIEDLADTASAMTALVSPQPPEPD